MCCPSVNSYLPAPSLIAQSAAALPLPCKGLWYVQTAAGEYDTYLATAAMLYKYDPGTSPSTDVSRLVGGLMACPPMTSGTACNTATGSSSAISAMRRNSSTSIADGVCRSAERADRPLRGCEGRPRSLHRICLTNPRAIAWSAINDSEDYTTGTSGTQEFADAGDVTGFCSTAAIVFLQRGLRGIVSTGDKYAFSFPAMSSEKGTVAPWSVLEFGALAYWLGDNGFYVGNANEQRSISEKRISGYFFENLNQANVTHIFSTFDPHASRIYWTYPTADTAWNDRALVYDWALDRWSELEVDTYIMSRLATVSVSLDAFTWPSMDDPGLPSLDSFFFRAGSPLLSAVGTDLRLSTMEGPNLPALIETGSYQFGGAKPGATALRAFLH